MQKKNIYFSIIFTILFASTICFNNNSQKTAGISEKQTEIDISLPKTSASKVTSLINYSLNGVIDNVVISEDGFYIGVVYGYNIALFNRTSTKPMWNFTFANNMAIMDIAISANGTYIAVGTENAVVLFNKTFSTEKTAMWNYTATGAYAYSVAISADGKYVAAGRGNSRIELFNKTYSTSKTPMWGFTTKQGNVNWVAISASGKYIAGGGNDDTVYFLNNSLSGSKTPMWSYNTTDDIKEVDISADGRYIAVAHYYNLSYFDTTQKIRLWKYDHYNYPVDSVDMSADGQYMVSRGSNSFKGAGPTSGFFDNSIETPKTSLWSYSGSSKDPKISADGYYAAVPHSNNISLLDKSASSGSKEYIWSYKMVGLAGDVAISANSSYIAAGCSDNQVYLLNWSAPEHYTIPSRALLASPSDDDDDDDAIEAIPFGNFYLVFVAIGVLSLILIQKRKVIFNKK